MQSYLWNSQLNHQRNDKLPRALYRFVFKLPWLVLLRTFCRQHYNVTQVNASLFSRHFLKPWLVKVNKGNHEVYIVYINICAWLFHCRVPSTILLGYSEADRCSEPKILFDIELIGSTILGFFKDKNGQELFLCFRHDIKKIHSLTVTC